MKQLFRAAMVALVLFAAPATAEELRWDMTLGIDRTATSDADPAAKRKVGMIAISGTAGIAGENAEVSIYALIDYANGSGPWQVYMTVAFHDGSILTAYGHGLTRADANGQNSRFEGPLLVVGGTGRYAGTRGSGSMSGWRTKTVGDAAAIRYEIALDLKR